MTLGPTERAPSPRPAEPAEPLDGDGAYLRTGFLARVAHDLRGPVGVTLRALEELEMSLGQEAPSHVELLALARRGVERVLRVADRLARAARLEGDGGLALSFAPEDVAAVVQRAVDMATRLSGKRDVVLSVVAPAEPAVAPVNAEWLGVAIAEIVDNALRHARRRVDVSTSPGEGSVVVSIRDDGVGMTAPERRRFTPSAEGRGLGLGLSLARDVVAAHGGALEVTAPAGAAGGTEVRVALPASRPARPFPRS